MRVNEILTRKTVFSRRVSVSPQHNNSKWESFIFLTPHVWCYKIQIVTWANVDHRSGRLYDTNLILHALGSAGRGVFGLHQLLLILLLQFGVLGVHTLHAYRRMQRLAELLDTLKEKWWNGHSYIKPFNVHRYSYFLKNGQDTTDLIVMSCF